MALRAMISALQFREMVHYLKPCKPQWPILSLLYNVIAANKANLESKVAKRSLFINHILDHKHYL